METTSSNLPRGRGYQGIIGTIDGLLDNTLGLVEDHEDKVNPAFSPKTQIESRGRQVGKYAVYTGAGIVATWFLYNNGSSFLNFLSEL